MSRTVHKWKKSQFVLQNNLCRTQSLTALMKMMKTDYEDDSYHYYDDNDKENA